MPAGLGDPGTDYGKCGSRGRRRSQAVQVRTTVDGPAQPAAKRGDAAVLTELDIDVSSCCDASLSARGSQTKLDFGQFSSAARDAEHRITLNDLVSALEHELHAAEVPECRPPPFDA